MAQSSKQGEEDAKKRASEAEEEEKKKPLPPLSPLPKEDPPEEREATNADLCALAFRVMPIVDAKNKHEKRPPGKGKTEEEKERAREEKQKEARTEMAQLEQQLREWKESYDQNQSKWKEDEREYQRNEGRVIWFRHRRLQLNVFGIELQEEEKAKYAEGKRLHANALKRESWARTCGAISKRARLQAARDSEDDE